MKKSCITFKPFTCITKTNHKSDTLVIMRSKRFAFVLAFIFSFSGLAVVTILVSN